MKQLTHSHAKQTGAALVVGLILLVVLTLMAISSMNTASLDLIMAGNEQYRQRAFTAAEAGIEQAYANGTYDTGSTNSVAATSTGLGNDTYQYSITPNLNFPSDPPVGYSLNAGSNLGAEYFTIVSTGKSERNAQAINTQGVAVIANASDIQKAKCANADLYAASSC